MDILHILLNLESGNAQILDELHKLSLLISQIAGIINGTELVTGITVSISDPLNRTKEHVYMANPTNFAILDNSNYLLTVQGSDSSQTPPVLSDISAVATLAISSDNPAVASVDAPIGMTALLHGLTVGTCNVTAVATWNDGSRGPFTVVQPITCSAPDTGVDGIVMTFGPAILR